MSCAHSEFGQFLAMNYEVVLGQIILCCDTVKKRPTKIFNHALSHDHRECVDNVVTFFIVIIIPFAFPLSLFLLFIIIIISFFF